MEENPMERQQEKLNNLRKWLEDLKCKNAINEDVYLVTKTVLKQAEMWMKMTFSPELQMNSLASDGLDTAERLIKSAKKKNS